MLFRLGFVEKWKRWIRACLHSSSVLVLVNGSPTREFKMSKGIRRGDPLAPFLFLIVAEGLHGHIRSAVEKGVYKEYVISERDREIGISNIQYADDTIFVGEMSISNVRAIKCILRCFELAARLKVNFHKSGLIGIKAKPGFLELASSILNCKIERLSFMFLGILIGEILHGRQLGLP